MDIVCKEVIYDFSNHPDYSKALSLAEKNIEEMYYANQKYEKDEAAEQLEDGEINSLDEYDFEYQEPFDKQNYAKQIYEKANEYMCNYLDLSSKVVIEVSADKVKDITSSEINQEIEKKYGVKVRDVKSFDKALDRDIWEQKSYDAVHEMQSNNNYKTFLELQSSLSNYSLNNICLIYAQKSTASVVMSLKKWNEEYDRQIIKGEHHMKIWCPNPRLLKTEKDVDSYLKYTYFADKDAEKDKMMKEIEENGFVKVNIGFNLGRVFDVSQTVPRDPQNDKLSEVLTMGKPLGKDMENYNEVMEAIFSVIADDSIQTSEHESEQDEIYGLVNAYSDYILSAKPDSIVGIKNRDVLHGDKHTLETLIATSLICEHIGLDSHEKTSFEIAKILDNVNNQFEHGKRNMFMETFDRGSKLARQFIKAFDKEMPLDKGKTVSKTKEQIEKE